MQIGPREDPGRMVDRPADPGEPQTRTSREVSRRMATGQARRWLSEPRSAVLVVLGGVVLLGGGWKLLQAWKARRLISRLGENDVTPVEVEAAASFGRAGLPELFRLLGEGPTGELRAAAGRAIAALWAGDELIAEEEQALLRRSFEVTWWARRTYPRALRTEIPIRVSYGVGFAADGAGGISPSNLEWSHRVIGSRRAALETYSDWKNGAEPFRFTVIPGDFEANGPHRLALQTRVRTFGLTSSWQIELPAVPFSFEFDPRLEVNSLLTLPDEERDRRLAGAIRLEAPSDPADQAPRFLPLNAEMILRDPPKLTVTTPLPCDLAHRALLELEGLDGLHPVGELVLGGQGSTRREEPFTPVVRQFPVDPGKPMDLAAIDRPGRRKVRVVLEPDPDLGWTDPDVRSIWPGTIRTGWYDAEIVRR